MVVSGVVLLLLVMVVVAVFVLVELVMYLPATQLVFRCFESS